jgi:hypothetical protein
MYNVQSRCTPPSVPLFEPLDATSCLLLELPVFRKSNYITKAFFDIE